MQRALEPVEDDLERHAARGVGLRVEEDLRVDDVIGRRAAQVRLREVVEVLLVQQHARAGVVDVEERLQVLELVGGAQGVHRGVREAHRVALGQGERELGLERAFDVDVQLGLRHAAGDGGDAARHGRPSYSSAGGAAQTCS